MAIWLMLRKLLTEKTWLHLKTMMTTNMQWFQGSTNREGLWMKSNINLKLKIIHKKNKTKDSNSLATIESKYILRIILL